VTAYPRNIRTDDVPDEARDAVLRASMETFGWVKHFPAIQDQDGKTLVGHRRLRIAKALRLEPVIKTVNCANNAARDQVAVAANVGYVQMSKEDRKRIAQRMYADPANTHTQAQIAAVLGVSQRQISTDVGDLEVVLNQNHARTERNPRGAGRPRGSGTPRAARPRQTENREQQIADLAATGMSSNAIAAELGVGPRAVRHELAREQHRREGAEQAAQIIDPSTLSLTAQEKLQAAIRQAKAKLEREYQSRMEKEVREHIKNAVVPAYEAKLKDSARAIEIARKMIRNRRGLLSNDTYKLISTCLHQDSRLSASEAKLHRAYLAFEALRPLIDADATPIETTLNFGDVLRNATRVRRTANRPNTPQQRRE
jgi:predicted transcriptional regulator